MKNKPATLKVNFHNFATQHYKSCTSPKCFVSSRHMSVRIVCKYNWPFVLWSPFHPQPCEYQRIVSIHKNIVISSWGPLESLQMWPEIFFVMSRRCSGVMECSETFKRYFQISAEHRSTIQRSAGDLLPVMCRRYNEVLLMWIRTHIGSNLWVI